MQLANTKSAHAHRSHYGGDRCTIPAEHTMAVLTGVFRAQQCTNDTTLEGYFRQTWPQLYSVVGYDGGILGFLIEILQYYCTFVWTYMDILIIASSICLSTRMKQFNNHLKNHKGMVCTDARYMRYGQL